MEVENGKVTDAWVCGTLFRGLELIMKNRAPEDAFYISQRICGVCPVSHGHTSSMATEAAFKVKIPNNARITRNLVEGAQFLHSHILWFYNLAALDWVDPSTVGKASIADTYALAAKAGTTAADFAKVQKRVVDLVDGGQLSIFSGGWFGNKAYRLPPELNLIAVAHYLEALQMQAQASMIAAEIGGKMPHIMTSIPGGTAWMPNEQRLADILYRVTVIRDWIASTMIPDVLAIAPFYLDALTYGQGVGAFAAWGVFDKKDGKPNDRYLPAGIIPKGQLIVNDVDEKLIKEYVDSSFYAPYPQGKGAGLNPLEGITVPEAPKYDTTTPGGKYTWSKNPRYEDQPYEVGGLSRVLIAYLRGVPEIKEMVDGVLAKLGKPGKPAPATALVSTLGRTAARPLEALYVANMMIENVTELVASLKGGDLAFFEPYDNTEGQGVGMWEAPRGALLHMTDVKGGKIQNYQCIVPSTWNVAPRDPKGVRGPMEEAIVGCPVEDLKQPLEALRTIHSFDPCIACAVHVVEPRTKKEVTIYTSPAVGTRGVF
jgi:[NiFe] hydrogenase large subunit